MGMGQTQILSHQRAKKKLPHDFFIHCEIRNNFVFKVWQEKTKKKPSLPHDFFSCCEIRNKDIFKAGLTKTFMMIWNLKKMLASMIHTKIIQRFNPLSPRDALKNHFTSLKTDLIFQQLRILDWKFLCNWFTNTWQFSLIFHPLQVIFIHYKSRIAAAIRGL